MKCVKRKRVNRQVVKSSKCTAQATVLTVNKSWSSPGQRGVPSCCLSAAGRVGGGWVPKRDTLPGEMNFSQSSARGNSVTEHNYIQFQRFGDVILSWCLAAFWLPDLNRTLSSSSSSIYWSFSDIIRNV